MESEEGKTEGEREGGMESFFPFIREWTERGDDSHRDDAGNFSDFLSRVSLVLLFPPPGASISLGGKASAPLPMATLGEDDCLDSELIVLISGLSSSNYVVRDLSPLSPYCVHSVVPIVPCPTSKVHKSGRVERAMERVASLPEIGSCR